MAEALAVGDLVPAPCVRADQHHLMERCGSCGWEHAHSAVSSLRATAEAVRALTEAAPPRAPLLAPDHQNMWTLGYLEAMDAVRNLLPGTTP